MYKMGVRWVESRKSETNIDEYALNCMVLDFIHNISIISQALQKGPKFGTWSQMGPKFQFGPKKSRFYLQVPNFCLYLQMLLKRGGTQQLVIAVPYLDIYCVCVCVSSLTT